MSPIIECPISETKNTAILAISSGSAYLPSGICSFNKFLLPLCISIGVAVGPGAKPFIVIPNFAYERAKPNVKPRSPHLLTVYAEIAGRKPRRRCYIQYISLNVVLCHIITEELSQEEYAL